MIGGVNWSPTIDGSNTLFDATLSGLLYEQYCRDDEPYDRHKGKQRYKCRRVELNALAADPDRLIDTPEIVRSAVEHINSTVDISTMAVLTVQWGADPQPSPWRHFVRAYVADALGERITDIEELYLTRPRSAVLVAFENAVLAANPRPLCVEYEFGPGSP